MGRVEELAFANTVLIFRVSQDGQISRRAEKLPKFRRPVSKSKGLPVEALQATHYRLYQ